MADFVPLAQRLRAPPLPPAAVALAQPAGDDAAPGASFAVVDLACMRLAAHEAFERAYERLLANLARDVLGRELAFAPCDIERLMRDALREFEREGPVAFVVRQSSLASLGGVPIRCDPSLAAGDLIVEVSDGQIDARFAVRLAGAIERATQP